MEIKYTHDVPTDLDETRLTYWFPKKANFYPAQVITILDNGKLLKRRMKQPKISYIDWMEQEKQRINNCVFAQRVHVITLLNKHEKEMLALFPFKTKVQLDNLNNNRNGRPVKK